MAKLNQIIALANGRKTRAKSQIDELHHGLQKKGLLDGLVRTYQPREEGGEQLPDERKGVQLVVRKAIEDVVEAWSSVIDIVATQDTGNTLAKADINIDGNVIAKDIPVTHLLFLEHQVEGLATFVDKLPTLDPADTWTWDENTNSYRSDVSETTRSKKTPKAFVKYDATPQHPAQVETFSEDVVIGTYKLTKFSGAIPAQDKAKIQARVFKLREGIKKAREAANSIDVQDVKVADSIFQYVFN